MINQIALTGRLTKDLELRYTQSGRAVSNFVLAVNRRFKDANGEREADFPQCVIWGKSAENFANYVHKGNLVGIEGRIQTRKYDNDQWQKVYVTEVVVENFSFLESKSSQSNQQGGFNQAPQNQPQPQYQNNNQQQQQYQQPQQYQPMQNQQPNGNFKGPGNSQPIDVDEDNLPF